MSEKILDFPRFSLWTWVIGIILATILLILWFTGRGPSQAGCCSVDLGAVAGPVAAVSNEPEAVEPAKSSAEIGATVQAATAARLFAAKQVDGKVILTGVVASEAARTQAVDFAKQSFGADRVVDQLTIDDKTATYPWFATLAEVFNWQKTVPDAGFEIDNNRLVLTGTVTSEAEKTARGDQAKQYFGPEVIIDNQIQVVAIAAVGDTVACGDRIAVAINFATGSSALNREAKAVLDQVFECVKAGRYEISGHTDNTGSAAVNQKLSMARAESTKAYLVEKGANAVDLSAAGYGADKSIASNGSTEGKAQNRRIEFVKQ
jgi:OmpA-OmpF porin, OOP family